MASLPIGRDWKMNVNSYYGSLFIDTIDVHNNITGRTRLVNEQEIKIFGAWDEATGKLSFIRQVAGNDVNQMQSFTGFLFNDGDGKTLVGTAQVYKGNTINGFNVGWYAHLQIIP